MGIIVDRVRSVTNGIIDDEQRGLIARSGCVNQIFILN